MAAESLTEMKGASGCGAPLLGVKLTLSGAMSGES
jgi:hypothetical protein